MYACGALISLSRDLLLKCLRRPILLLLKDVLLRREGRDYDYRNVVAGIVLTSKQYPRIWMRLCGIR